MTKSLTEKQTIQEFGSNLRRERMAQNLTQEYLAEAAGLHPRTLQKIERGDIDILLTTIRRIQAALDCPWDVLFRPGPRPVAAQVPKKPAKGRKRTKG
ncbi:MAG: helix-turn-helix domain-containing protein [Verrucomicrobia bacterium]|nr:helix-turn-helix domain-containing protein [Verrucomicrobiota bacterium]